MKKVSGQGRPNAKSAQVSESLPLLSVLLGSRFFTFCCYPETENQTTDSHEDFYTYNLWLKISL